MFNFSPHKIRSLPVLVLMPHSSCNCRCVMCDIWKANHHKKEISVEELERHIVAFRKLKVKEVALSGGEALLHSNFWKFCELLKDIQVKITLLSTGISLGHHANDVVKHVHEVIVSLDGSREVHNQIRNIPSAFEKLEAGVRSIKKINPSFPLKARCVLQKQNYQDFQNIIQVAKQIGLDQISFLAADVSTDAFNRAEPWDEEKQSTIALNENDCQNLYSILQDSFLKFRKDYQSKFIAESPEKMKELHQYYTALLGLSAFPKRRCNAPWVSAVVEADGEVKPCFFHPAYGTLYNNDFLEVINSESAISFRKNLDVQKNSICQRCVCSLYR